MDFEEEVDLQEAGKPQMCREELAMLEKLA